MLTTQHCLKEHFSVFSPNGGKLGPEKLRIWTLFMLYKIAREIHSTWYFKKVANVKLTEHGGIHKPSHVTDSHNLMNTGN